MKWRNVRILWRASFSSRTKLSSKRRHRCERRSRPFGGSSGNSPVRVPKEFNRSLPIFDVTLWAILALQREGCTVGRFRRPAETTRQGQGGNCRAEGGKRQTEVGQNFSVSYRCRLRSCRAPSSRLCFAALWCRICEVTLKIRKATSRFSKRRFMTGKSSCRFSNPFLTHHAREQQHGF